MRFCGQKRKVLKYSEKWLKGKKPITVGHVFQRITIGIIFDRWSPTDPHLIGRDDEKTLSSCIDQSDDTIHLL